MNSVTGEDEVLERVLPLVAKYGAAVVAISNDETGISEDPNERFKVAKKIVERAADHGIPYSDVVVDPRAEEDDAIGHQAREDIHFTEGHRALFNDGSGHVLRTCNWTLRG